ncbi:hypothetical protein GCM10010216_53700 [Streptomyces flaveolus]|nr:hypothetical protein GCM10010216_53700 [Streptomyces flaveolus]
MALLDRWPTVRGEVLVAPKAHIEHLVLDLDEGAYLRLTRVVRRVALAVEGVCGVERTYLYPSAAGRATPTCTGTSPPSRPASPTNNSSPTL